MAWWAGRRSGQGGYGTHQEKKEGSKHKRSGDKQRSLTDERVAWDSQCQCGHSWLAHEPHCVVTVYAAKQSCSENCRSFEMDLGD